MGSSSSPNSSSGTSSIHSSRLKRWRVALQHWATDVSWGQELSGSLGDLGTFLPLVVSNMSDLSSLMLACSSHSPSSSSCLKAAWLTVGVSRLPYGGLWLQYVFQ